tara:strand:- start:907 stop:2154 length:1248 start_codon:yes stop_codon:yes gene_type:complete
LHIYKYIIAGAGPIGYHVFNIFKDKSIMITGFTKKKISSKNLHPKIKLQVNKYTNKFSDLYRSEGNEFHIYSSSEIGGNTNYWGKKFFDYNINDPWPKEIFKSYKVYEKNLRKIDKIYHSKKANVINSVNAGKLKINQIQPPLVTNSIVKKSIINKNSNKVIQDRIISFRKIKKNLFIINTENTNFYCRNLILCAGPIGNALILLRSFIKIKYVKFKDHNPRVLIGFRIKNFFIKNDNNNQVLDFEIVKNNKILNYLTIYNLNFNHFKKFYRPLLSFFKNIINKFFYYGQFWVVDEYNEIKIINNETIQVNGKNKIKNKKNIYLINNIKKIGLNIIKILSLKKAYGFHYHCLEVNYGGQLLSLNKFLNKMRMSKNIYCFDSSVISKIGIKPPTKTYIAVANYLAEKLAIASLKNK